jgi:predicted nucleic acid-binding protein
MAIPKVYVETSVISYLTAKPSRDLIVAAHQQVTREWWSRRKRFELFVSEAVVEEAKRGDKAAAARRKVAIEGIPILSAPALAQTLAANFLRAAVMPSNAAIDAVHVAVATTHGMDFLVTWNCTHIANAIVREKIETVCRKAGFRPPVICTPLELPEEES